MAIAHWTVDNWATTNDTETRPMGVGVYIVDIPVDKQPKNTTLTFSFRWSASNAWEGVNFSIAIV